MRFVYLGPGVCLQLPPDASSRLRPCCSARSSCHQGLQRTFTFKSLPGRLSPSGWPAGPARCAPCLSHDRGRLARTKPGTAVAVYHMANRPPISNPSPFVSMIHCLLTPSRQWMSRPERTPPARREHIEALLHTGHGEYWLKPNRSPHFFLNWKGIRAEVFSVLILARSLISPLEHPQQLPTLNRRSTVNNMG